MKEWVARLLEEKNELSERQRKLSGFLKSKVQLTEKQRDLMNRQLEAMKTYEDILHERIVLESEIARKKEI